MADDLAEFVAFACDQQHITCTEFGNGSCDGFGAIGNFSCVGCAHHHLAPNGCCIFRTRIIVGHVNCISIDCCGFRHQGALAFVTVATTTEDNMKLARHG